MPKFLKTLLHNHFCAYWDTLYLQELDVVEQVDMDIRIVSGFNEVLQNENF